MKKRTGTNTIRGLTITAIVAAIAFLPAASHAANVVSVDPVTDVGGSTFTVQGTSFTFPNAGKYSSVVDSGNDRTATIAASPPNNDFYFEKSGFSLDTTVYQYAQMYYSLDAAFAGSTQQLRLDTTDQAANFVTFSNAASIPSTLGAHSFVIDLVDGTNLGGGGYSGNLNYFRWDWWNNGGNTTKAFTLDKVVFGSALDGVAVPDSGFENPVQPNTNGTTRYKLGNGGGSGTLVGSAWDFGAAPSGITRNASDFSPPPAPEGVQAMLLRSSNTVSTTVTGFEAGATYTLSFEAAGRNGSPNDFRVLLDGMALEFGGDTTIDPATNSYGTFTSDEFATSGGDLTLAFQGLIGGDNTAFIDDVRFTFVAAPVFVPEPSAFVITGLGLLGLIGFAWRRRPRFVAGPRR